MDLKKYIAVEEGLTAKLQKAWRKEAVKLYAKMLKHVERAEFDEARKLISEIDLTEVGDKNRGVIRAYLSASIAFGAKVAAGPKSMVAMTKDKTLLDRVVNVFCLALEWNATVYTVRAAVQSIAAAEKAYAEATELVKKAESKRRFVREFVSFQKNGDDMIQLISALNTSRLATWGFTGECELLGVTQYQLQAVMDGRTSEFCQLINGKVFNVADARETVTQVLALDNPDDAKQIQPWPKQNKETLAAYGKMSAEELTNLNLHIPPFHPGCRTLCVKLGTQVLVTENFKPVTEDQAAALSKKGQLTGPLPRKFEDKAAFNEYTGSEYRRINSFLRSDEYTWADEATKVKTLETIDRIASHLSSKKSVMKQDMLLYRGMSGDFLVEKKLGVKQGSLSNADGVFPEDLVGTVFDDAGFMSFSYKQETIEGFTGGFMPMRMRLRVSKGETGWADLEEVAGLSEAEVLRRGGRFRIVAYDANTGMFDIESLD